MRSVDTNVIVRLLARDDEPQFHLANSIFARGDIWIAKTVVLETEWVLRSRYRFTPEAVLAALQGLLCLNGVTVEDEEAVSIALDLLAQGLDFADAMHLASRPEGSSFVTFDEAFVRRAKQAGVTRISNAAH
jgi:predicted nucleic-acid-binding protein